jgi:xanthine dehydrogenase YagR molybdenum-binding subunit
MQMHTVLAAVAARRLGKPVKLVIPRWQVFHGASFRPASRHRVRLGASRSGQVVAALYNVDQQTSRHDFFPAAYCELAARLYGVANFTGHERLVRTDVQTPGYMRGPHEHPAAFAFESAVDELAYALNQDPVDLRISNDTNADPLTGKPFSSRHLAECLRRGAERFGWARRSMAPGSMRADGMLVGWGVAAGAYPAHDVPAIARLRLNSDGTASVAVGGHEMGQGMRTVLANVVASQLKCAIADVTVLLGDTNSVPHHLTAGSWGTAATVSAVSKAANELLQGLNRIDPTAGVNPAAALKRAGRPFSEVEIRHTAPSCPHAHSAPSGASCRSGGRLTSRLAMSSRG